MGPAATLRQIIDTPGITLSVSAHDPLLARLVERAGFEMIGLSGNAVAAAHLGMPDMGFLNLSDMVDVSRRIAAAVDIPVLVDADTGYGNAMNVVRTVREFERAGIAGIIIEDQIDYKKCGMIETAHPVVPAEEHAAKVRAACAARTNPNFVICARTCVAADHGVADPLGRARLYFQAGADLLDVEILGKPGEVAEIGAGELTVPLKGNMDEGKRLWEIDAKTLERAGYRICTHPGLVRYTVVHAVKEALEHLKREGSTIGYRDKMATTKEYFDAVDLERYLEMERDLLRPFSSSDAGR